VKPSAKDFSMTSRAWQENAASADVTAAEHRLSKHGDVTKSKDRRRGSQQQTDTGSENNWTSSGETTKRGSVELAPDFELTHIRAKVLEKYGDFVQPQWQGQKPRCPSTVRFTSLYFSLNLHSCSVKLAGQIADLRNLKLRWLSERQCGDLQSLTVKAASEVIELESISFKLADV